MPESIANTNVSIEKRVIATLLAEFRETGLDEDSFTDIYCQEIFRIMEREKDPVKINVAISSNPALLDFCDELPPSLPEDQTSISILRELEHKRSNLDLIAQYADDPTELSLRLRANEGEGEAESALNMFDDEAELERVCSATPIRTHLQTFNNAVKIQPGELIVLTADTSAGKTQLLLNFAKDFGTLGKRVMFASLEMNKYQIEVRLQNMFLNKPINEIYPGPQYKADCKRIRSSAMQASRDILKNIYFYTKSPFFQDIIHQIDLIRPDVVIIDYFQIMSSKLSRGENEDQRYMALSLRSLAKERPFIIASQFKKKSALSGERDLDDIYGTCALPQSASVSVFLHREKSKESVLLDEITYDINKNRTWSTRVYDIPLVLKSDGMFVERA